MTDAVQPLSHCHIAVTRPQPEAGALARILEAEGAQVVQSPTLKIVPRPPAYDPPLTQTDAIVFMSKNAVRYALACLAKQDPMWWRGKFITAVGSGTAQVLTAQGIPVNAVPGQANSEGVLSLLLDQYPPLNRILIFKGEGGNPLLETAYPKHGRQCDVITVYQRVPIVYTQADLTRLFETTPDIFVTTSSEGLQALAALQPKLPFRLMQLPVVVISESMLSYAHRLGFQACVLAQGAHHEAILTALIDWVRHHHDRHQR